MMHIVEFQYDKLIYKNELQFTTEQRLKTSKTYMFIKGQ